MSADKPDTTHAAPPSRLGLADLEPIFRAARKIAKWRGVSVADVLGTAPSVWNDREVAGGRRAGAGRKARDWSSLTACVDQHGVVPGFALGELELAVVVQKALLPAGTSNAQAFGDDNPQSRRHAVARQGAVLGISTCS